MKETYLKHVVVVVVSLCVTVLAALNPALQDQALLIYATIMGYVFKNGVTPARAPPG